MAVEAGFDEEEWLPGRSMDFTRHAGRTFDAKDKIIQAFDTLINEQRFSSVQHWKDSLIAMLERLSPSQTPPLQDSET